MKKRRKKKIPKQSLAKNIALLFLSLGILAGASVLFSTINNKSEFSFNPLQHSWNDILTEQERTESGQDDAVSQKSAIGPFEYTFYDILFKKDAEESGSEHYSIQIAAFKTTEQAEKFAQDLKEKARLRCRVEQKGTWSCVRWGSFSTKASAQRYNEKLSAKLQRNCIIVKM
ncbi:MAG: SPOR domain-containing protein [Desulfomonilia bacterium]